MAGRRTDDERPWERRKDRDKRRKQDHRKPFLTDGDAELPTTAKVLFLPRLDVNASATPQMLQVIAQYRRGIPAWRTEIDFTDVAAVDSEVTVLLGILFRLIESHGGTVRLRTDTLKDRTRRQLTESGFLSTFGVAPAPRLGRILPYREDRIVDYDDIVKYLETSFLVGGILRLSPELKDELAGRFAELYLNASDHARSPIGIFSCGHYNAETSRLNFVVADFGAGIPSTVRKFLHRPGMPGTEAIEWAFGERHTTKPGREPRGNGLPLLEKFTNRYSGRLEIRSNDGRLVNQDARMRVEQANIAVHGTLVRVTLHCDTRLYGIKPEADAEIRF